MRHKNDPFISKCSGIFRVVFLLAAFLSACQSNPNIPLSSNTTIKAIQNSDTFSPSSDQPTRVASVSPVIGGPAASSPPLRYPSSTAKFSPTSCSRTILFYGDSRLGALGVSFVDDLKKLIDPCYNLINAGYWAHTAQWGSANIQDKVISKNPDDVALWWGANDFNGCNGTTDPNTDLPDMVKFDARLNAYLSAMEQQIEVLARLGKTVYVFDEPRVQGGLLPWAIVDATGNITGYDHNHICSWNWLSDAVSQAQKQLVETETDKGYKVFLVDVWQLYMDEGDLPDMYSTDVVHPGNLGREKIAELFMKVYLPQP